ncbi:MAG: prolyl oligopeptidase family serine peptidase [Bacteroidota bacterium]
MMKPIVLLFTSICSSVIIYAQKPVLDTSILDKWEVIKTPAQISDDGKFTITVTGQRSNSNNNVVTVKATDGSWELKLTNILGIQITKLRNYAVFKKGDSLCLLALGTSLIKYIPKVSSFRLCDKDDGQWLIYQIRNATTDLVIQDIETGKQQTFPSVENYVVGNNGKALVLQSVEEPRERGLRKLEFIQLASDTRYQFWEGKKADNIIIAPDNDRVAFFVNESDIQLAISSIWCYKIGDESALKMVENSTFKKKYPQLKIEKGGRNWRFSKDGSRLFFSLKEEQDRYPDSRAAKVDLWSYSDVNLQSKQVKQATLKSYAAVIGLEDRDVIRLQYPGDEGITFVEGGKDEIAYIYHFEGDFGESNWNQFAKPYFILLSTRTGDRRDIQIPDGSYIQEGSPDGKYLLLIDQKVTRKFMIYEIATAKVTTTGNFPFSLIDSTDEKPNTKQSILSFGLWSKDGHSFYFYDKFDIWKVDLTGNHNPISITRGFGRKHNLIFKFIVGYPTLYIDDNKDVQIISAFANENKKNGFYKISLLAKKDPELLTMGNYVYFAPQHFPTILPGIVPIKAKAADVYIVSRESATESPNYFVTRDFQSFKALTNVHPELAYNWLTTELIRWETSKGRFSEGILYKPENFEPNKKYPIIFHYYEKFSDELNVYKRPDYTEGRINIPWFVSQGYLVFVPDIHYIIGQAGKSALNSIVSATNELSKNVWVDHKHMGLYGHSWASFETDYIITHSDLFKAAVSACGFASIITNYGSITLYNGASLQSFAEHGQTRIGKTLWERPDLYIENSAIFKADKINTPILMMNNKEDGIVPFAQGIEFFTALRRLGKKAWMLQYDGEVHALSSESNAAKDYTIRVNQFLDHYLKNAPAPIWMTRGIPAKLKGIETGLEYDTEIKTPGDSPLIEKSKKK